MKHYLVIILTLCFIISNAQEERVLKIQSVNISDGRVHNQIMNYKIGGNIILLNQESPYGTNEYGDPIGGQQIMSNAIDNNNSFIVYTKEKIDELQENQKKYIGIQADSIKIFLKHLIDSLPQQTFVITVQEQIQESTIDKLRKEDIAQQNQEIVFLKEEITKLKEEIEELKKKPRN